MSARLKAAMLVPLAGLAGLSAPASAQETGATVPVQREADTPADRFGFIDGAQLQVTSGTDEDNLTFRIALPASPSMASRFSLTLATPLQGDEEAMPASLDALANGTRATLSWGYFDVRVIRPDAEIHELRARARRLCREREPAETRPRCRDSAFAMRKYGSDDAALDRRRTTPAATDFGIQATAGFNDFEWVDPVSLLPQEDRRTDWAVAAHVAHYLPNSHTALTASVSYQRAYEAAEEQEICPPSSADPDDCRKVRTAAPSRNENLLLSAGVRHRFFENGSLANLAIAPVVTYDVLDDVFGVDVPIYYTPTGDGRLNGGIRFGYRSDRENEFSVSFFVGTTFDIFGGGS
ncbi:MAG TPA: hypothetical protein VLK25_08875 [Allosphingosinicella sp.]|nr:hypothetical protein [Allosphingosinicella sp.]